MSHQHEYLLNESKKVHVKRAGPCYSHYNEIPLGNERHGSTATSRHYATQSSCVAENSSCKEIKKVRDRPSDLFFAMPNFGSHTTFFTANLTSVSYTHLTLPTKA